MELLAAAGGPEVADDAAVVEAADLLAQVVDPGRGDRARRGVGHPRGVASDGVGEPFRSRDAPGARVGFSALRGSKIDVIVDEASEVVLGVEVRAGNAGDGEGAAPLLEEVLSNDGVEVETLLADMAYSDGVVREAVEDHGVEMEAKVPPVTNVGRFPRTDFTIDTAAGSLTCSAGNNTTDPHKTKNRKGPPATAYRFAANVCVASPLREQCQIVVGRHHDRVQAARRAQADRATKALLCRRPKVEGKIDHLQDLGMGKARYPDRRKTGCRPCLQRPSPTSSASSSSTRWKTRSARTMPRRRGR